MKALKVFALAILMVMVAVPFAGAQTITWNSSFTVVNLGSTDATVTATFYDEAGTDYTPNPLVPGTTPIPNPFTLAAGGSQIIVMAYVNSTLPNGRYSVVLSADQPIVAIANLAGAEAPYSYNGSYSGSEDVGQTIAYLPSVSNSFYGWFSHLSVQNLTNAAMDVTVTFFAGTTSPIGTITNNVPAYSSWHLDMDDAGITPALPIDYNGSATVEAAGPIAVVNNDYNQTQQHGAEQTYSGAVAGALDLYCPGLYDQFVGLWISSLNVQNIGSSDANVTVWYSDGMSDTTVIAPSASWLGVYMSGAHSSGFFSAHVESTNGQNLVAVANATLPSGGSSQTYECASSGYTTLNTPLAMKWFIGQYNTGIQVQNIGATAADITITYEGGCTEMQNAAANGVVIFYTPGNTCLPANWSGSAAVTSANNLVGIVNQNNEAPGAGEMGDFALSFLMFGQ